jgi:hypothetical protein
MEREYKALEAAYLKAKRQPADELLVNLAGQVVMRPNPDSGRSAAALVVERHIGIWPEKNAEFPSPPPATGNLLEVDAARGQPVILVEKQRERSLVFRIQ